MPVNPLTFLDDMRDFTVTSLAWCASESEAEATRIYDNLQLLMADVKRRSSMSKTALTAVTELQEAILQKPVKGGKGDVKSLLGVLKRFTDSHSEIAELTTPIIEALQFQDRLRQNLENVGKILTVWLQQRQALAAGADADESLQSLGQAFLKCTTSIEERDVIRQMIAGLPAETKSEDAILF